MSRTTGTVHASCVAIGAAGVLIRGPSGTGKSALALALVDTATTNGQFAALVGDDRVELHARAGRLIARVPAPIAGLVEQRGGRIRRVPFLPAAVVRLVVDLVTDSDLERLPDDDALATAVCGLELHRQPVPQRDTTRAVALVRAALLEATQPTRQVAS